MLKRTLSNLRNYQPPAKHALTRFANTRNISNMSLIQHFAPFHRNSPSGDFAPFFRFLDDYADHALRRFGPQSQLGAINSWTPKFDIQEKEDSYELHGELPGVDSKNVDIEFADKYNLRISGHTQHESTTQSPPEGTDGGAATESAAEDAQAKQPTVEDENDAGNTQSQPSETAVTKTAEAGEVAPQPTPSRKWVSVERSYGKFSRSFQFPTEIDTENVKASLKNGILDLHIPKSPSAQPKKVNIEA